jgi:rfaE bifunctional protein nucleotidyltransferase chain/domain
VKTVNGLIPRKKLQQTVRRIRRSGKRIVFTNGCFDILHSGHVRYLNEAKKLGDILIIGLNSDGSVRRLKGKSRPVFSQKERAVLLLGLESVDYVTVFTEDEPYRTIKSIRPDVLVKGGDWKRGRIVGEDFVGSYGGRVYSLKYFKSSSTSSVIKKIIGSHGGD